jgi:hypothetical protein
MKNKFAMFTIIAILGLALVASIATVNTVSASDNDNADLTATPDNSNIFNFTGTGFNEDEEVTLELETNDTTYYTITDDVEITTDANGTFTATVIIPTSIDGGDYNLTASTDDYTAYIEVTIPELTGETGATGATGSTGETGQTGTAGEDGADGKDADSTLTYGAIGIGLLGLLVGTYAIIKKPSV